MNSDGAQIGVSADRALKRVSLRREDLAAVVEGLGEVGPPPPEEWDDDDDGQRVWKPLTPAQRKVVTDLLDGSYSSGPLPGQ